MFDPHFRQVISMCENIAKVHQGQMEYMKLVWTELKTPDGDVYQIVPVVDVVFK